ncbi:hypothetical protein M8J76_013621 [Diaphorina citri]|nr:hypothetical protein M8J75_004665 [Diaphorina citri]KAI5737442.1 hypothetical protein M8J76_013621 [Diaphorina citri]
MIVSPWETSNSNEMSSKSHLPNATFRRQRLPSTDSDTSLIVSDGLSADEFCFAETEHPNQVLTGFNEARKNNEFCDVTLCVDGTKFPAHRVVLAASSPYFKAMFHSRCLEAKQNNIQMKGIDVEMMTLLLEYCYSSRITITRNNCQALLSAANLLQILPVKAAACTFLQQHMDASNCLGIHCFAEQHACTELQNEAKDFVLANFSAVCQNEEFLSLPASKLIELTSSDNLEIDKEEMLFQAVQRWLQYDVLARSVDFPLVLETIRLPQLSPYFLHDCVEQCAIIKNNPQCAQLVEEAKLFHLLPDRRSAHITPRTKPRKSAGSINVIIAVGGEDDKVVLRSVEGFCVKTKVWKTLSCLPFAISKHGLVVSGRNTIYLVGGEFPDGNASASVWKYDPVLDHWQEEVAPLLNPRSELGIAMLDGFVYAVGGWDGSCRLDSVERYDPTKNEWSYIEPMKLAVTSPAVVAHEGMLYVTGGAILEDGDGIEQVQRYNPKVNQWQDLAPMLIPRSGAAICALDSCIYVLGGWHASTENTNRVECYHIAENTWEYKSPMKEKRYRPGIAVIDGKIYVLGGEEGWDGYHDSIECYDVDNDSWEIMSHLPSARSWLGCVPLQIHKSQFVDKS